MSNEIIEKFIAAAQTAQATLAARQQMMIDELTHSEQFIEQQLQNITNIVTRLQTILAAPGMEEWRTKTEAIYQESKEHAQKMQEAYRDIQRAVKESCTYLEKNSVQTIKNINKDFHHLVNDVHEEVHKVAGSAVQQMSIVVKWFNWKNLGLVFFLSLIITIATGLYTDDEWPWEVHKNVLKQRAAGQAVLDAWHQLSPADQHLLSRAMHNAGGG